VICTYCKTDITSSEAYVLVLVEPNLYNPHRETFWRPLKVPKVKHGRNASPILHKNCAELEAMSNRRIELLVDLKHRNTVRIHT
jgi:hypothetical protein